MGQIQLNKNQSQFNNVLNENAYDNYDKLLKDEKNLTPYEPGQST